MKVHVLETTVSLASVALAQNYLYPVGLSPGSAPRSYSQLFIDANNQPNASNTVSFQHDLNTGNTSLAGNWSWTIKTSDVLVPANSSSSGIPENRHVAYTTYEFTWPTDGNLDQALLAEESGEPERFPSCAFLFTATFPQNVSRKFDEANGSNCTSILGAECVKNLTAAAAGSHDCRSATFNSGSSAFQAACGSSFGAVLGGGWALLGSEFGNASQARNATANALQKKQTYAYTLSAPYPADNLTVFNQTKENVHVLVLTNVLSGLDTTNVLCNRAGDGSSFTSAAARRDGAVLATVGAVVLVAALLNC